MNTQKRYWTLFLISLAGSLFAGYLSAGKLFTQNCVLDTSCSYFFGYPTCYFGFGLFFILLLASFVLVTRGTRLMLPVMYTIATLGVLFSGYFTVVEVTPMFTQDLTYTLLLPTCAYGLVFFILIAILAYNTARKASA